jgi:hypothetical protein
MASYHTPVVLHCTIIGFVSFFIIL